MKQLHSVSFTLLKSCFSFFWSLILTWHLRISTFCLLPRLSPKEMCVTFNIGACVLDFAVIVNPHLCSLYIFTISRNNKSHFFQQRPTSILIWAFLASGCTWIWWSLVLILLKINKGLWFLCFTIFLATKRGAKYQFERCKSIKKQNIGGSQKKKTKQ